MKTETEIEREAIKKTLYLVCNCYKDKRRLLPDIMNDRYSCLNCNKGISFFLQKEGY